ncbi:MAG: HAD-IB family phosphatase [Candidatus Gracilibacteria bacterium]|jgi:HAD superfamily phosphoserine phosphatase-like hydrolase
MKNTGIPEGKIPLVAAFDIEATLTHVEGWNFLAEKATPEIQKIIKTLTDRAMGGKMPFKESLFERFDIFKPGPVEIKILQDEYLRHPHHDVKRLIAFLREKFARVVLISGGLQNALSPFAEEIGIAHEDLFAIPLTPQWKLPDGHPLYAEDGKKLVLNRIIAEERARRDPKNRIDFHSIMTGDGVTDAKCRGSNVTFIAIGNREEVIKAADIHIETLDEIYPLILNPYSHGQIQARGREANDAR